MAASGAAIELCSIEPADYRATAEFAATAFGNGEQAGATDAWLDWFHRCWDVNPSMRADLARGWLQRDAGGAIVACMANIPLRYVIDDEVVTACAASSLVVDERFRGQGLAKQIGRAFLEQAGVRLWIGTGSSEPALRMWKALGMKDLPHAWTCTNYILPADHRRFLAYVLRPFRTLRAIAPLLRPLLAGVAAATRLRGQADLRVAPIGSFDPAAAATIGGWLRNRNVHASAQAEILNWFYFATPPLREKRVVLAAHSGHDLLGFVGLKREVQPVAKFDVLECRVRDDDPLLYRTLLAAAVRWATDQGGAYLGIRPTTPSLVRVLARCAPFRSHRRFTYVYRFTEPEPDISRWDTGPLDGDVGLL